MENDSLILKVGNIPVKVVFKDAFLRDTFYQQYSGFLSNEEEHNGKLVIKQKKGAGLPREKIWPMKITRQEETILVKSFGVLGYFNENFVGELETESVWALENFLRAYFAFLLLFNNSLLIHGAGIEYKGNGYLFVGTSGAGKSTISLLLKEKAITYSDDIVIVRKRGENFYLYSTPFRGVETLWLGKDRNVPLYKIFLLNKSSKTFSISASVGEAMSSIIANSPFVNSFEDVSGKLFNVVTMLVNSLPIHKLFFKKDDPIWEVVF